MEEALRRALRERPKLSINDPRRIPSAVLLPLYRKHGQLHLMFIQRTDRVRDHKGQISFPGGAYEDGDGSLLQTALREASEEVGLRAEDVDVIGELDDICTIGSGYVISPFVGVFPWPYDLKVDQWETEEIIEVPLCSLLDKGCVRHDTDVLDGNVIDTYFYHYGDKVIWGATARILNQFLGIVAEAVGGGP